MSMIEYKHGIFFDIPEAEYHKHPALSCSAFKEFLKGAAHYKRYLRQGRKQTAAMKFGTLFDIYLMDRARFDRECVNDGGRQYRSNADKEWRDEHIANGLTIYGPDDLAKLERMAKAVWAFEPAASLIAKAKFQVTVYAPYTFPDGYTIETKARIDILPTFAAAVVDLKKTVDASPDGFGKQVFDFGYHLQAGWYRKAYNTIAGDDPRDSFVFIAVQEDAEVDDRDEVLGVGVYSLKPDALELSDDIIEAGMRRFRACQELNKWPGVEKELQWVDLPKWATDKENRRREALKIEDPAFMTEVAA
jgi:hypothetical protein